jgi:hypothetical protein
VNDEAKRNMRELFARIGDWLYDHAAETLGGAVAVVAGVAFGLWLHVGAVNERLDAIAGEQQHERLCQRLSACPVWREVAAATKECQMDQMLCKDRIQNISNRLIEIERRLNRTTSP